MTHLKLIYQNKSKFNDLVNFFLSTEETSVCLESHFLHWYLYFYRGFINIIPYLHVFKVSNEANSGKLKPSVRLWYIYGSLTKHIPPLSLCVLKEST